MAAKIMIILKTGTLTLTALEAVHSVQVSTASPPEASLIRGHGSQGCGATTAVGLPWPQRLAYPCVRA